LGIFTKKSQFFRQPRRKFSNFYHTYFFRFSTFGFGFEKSRFFRFRFWLLGEICRLPEIFFWNFGLKFLLMFFIWLLTTIWDTPSEARRKNFAKVQLSQAILKHFGASEKFVRTSENRKNQKREICQTIIPVFKNRCPQSILFRKKNYASESAVFAGTFYIMSRVHEY